MKSGKNRILRALSSNAYSQATSTLIQLGTIPIFLLHWDATQLGAWILISTLPTYLALADFGISPTVANRLQILYQRGNLVDFEKTNNAAHRIFNLISLLIFSGAILIGGIYSQGSDVLPHAEITIAAMMITSAINLRLSLCEGLLRAVDAYALGMTLMSTLRLLEWIGIIIALFISGSAAAMACSALVIKFLSLLSIVAWSRQKYPCLRPSKANPDSGELKSLLRNGASFLAFPVGNALQLQSMVMLCGWLAGPATVALFSTYRTIARALVQLSTLINRSVWPEFTRLFANTDIPAIRVLYDRSLRYSTLGSGTLAIGIYFLGPWIVERWTNGHIPWNPTLLALALGSSVICAIWQVPFVLLSAIGEHGRLSVFYLGFSSLVVLVGALMSEVVQTATALGISMVIGDLLIFGTAMYLVKNWWTQC